MMQRKGRKLLKGRRCGTDLRKAGKEKGVGKVRKTRKVNEVVQKGWTGAY